MPASLDREEQHIYVSIETRKINGDTAKRIVFVGKQEEILENRK
jgi:hypothetical protein